MAPTGRPSASCAGGAPKNVRKSSYVPSTRWTFIRSMGSRPDIIARRGAGALADPEKGGEARPGRRRKKAGRGHPA